MKDYCATITFKKSWASCVGANDKEEAIEKAMKEWPGIEILAEHNEEWLDRPKPPAVEFTHGTPYWMES